MIIERARFVWGRCILVMLVSFCLSCAASGTRTPLARGAFTVDSVHTTAVAQDITYRELFLGGGPWVVHLLEVPLDRCTTLEAVKGTQGAIGRERTSTLLDRLADSVNVIGGVNADFFLFAPPGVPTNAHIHDGVVVTGPNPQPVFALERDGRPWMGTLQVQGEATIAGASQLIAGWNRYVATGLSYFDRSWGAALDTLTGAIEVVLSADTPRRVIGVDTATAGVILPPGGVVLIAGRAAPVDLRNRLLALRLGDPVETWIRLAPLHPEEAVGGRPIVLTDGVITAAARDSNAFSVTRHPRTAVGVRGDGKVMLLVVDGRQPGWSVGMSLLELAQLFQQLGARDAINLDGGGSSALAVRRGDAMQVMNRPSDPQGERPVANALAVVQRC